MLIRTPKGYRARDGRPRLTVQARAIQEQAPSHTVAAKIIMRMLSIERATSPGRAVSTNADNE
jgi:hypothetical protein